MPHDDEAPSHRVPSHRLPGPADPTIRPERPEDHDGLRELLMAAFPTAEEADLVDALRLDPAWMPGLSWVAVAPDSQVVGQALLTRCHIGQTAALCLAPCAVLPGWQGRGVGSAVIRAALEAAREAGEDAVVVLGHPEYYPRFGFQRADEHGVELSVPVPPEALRVLSLRGGEVPSGTVRYAPPFGDF